MTQALQLYGNPLEYIPELSPCTVTPFLGPLDDQLRTCKLCSHAHAGPAGAVGPAGPVAVWPSPGLHP